MMTNEEMLSCLMDIHEQLFHDRDSGKRIYGDILTVA